MEEKTDRLFAGFPPVSSREWEAKIREDLKGADYEKKLIWKTPEGFKVKPFYTADDLHELQYPESEPGEFPFVRGDKATGNAWEIRQDFTVFDVPAAVARPPWPLKMASLRWDSTYPARATCITTTSGR